MWHIVNWFLQILWMNLWEWYTYITRWTFAFSLPSPGPTGKNTSGGTYSTRVKGVCSPNTRLVKLFLTHKLPNLFQGMWSVLNASHRLIRRPQLPNQQNLLCIRYLNNISFSTISLVRLHWNTVYEIWVMLFSQNFPEQWVCLHGLHFPV